MQFLLVEFELYMGRSIEIDSHTIVSPRPGAIEIIGCDSADSFRSITRRFLPKSHSRLFMVGGAVVLEPIDGLITTCHDEALLARAILHHGDCFVMFVNESHRVELIVH